MDNESFTEEQRGTLLKKVSLCKENKTHPKEKKEKNSLVISLKYRPPVVSQIAETIKEQFKLRKPVVLSIAMFYHLSGDTDPSKSVSARTTSHPAKSGPQASDGRYQLPNVEGNANLKTDLEDKTSSCDKTRNCHQYSVNRPMSN
ncbi:hypothetical protein P5673_016884 [Acropora cervicornis]|uniref:Uncharacterized protein n=1 Tax=Acropora cervicornis TaxID=6130 RepID=A0AAD9V435_ACRCE|nr:hypothetical protein P5673_016884 [Acropora cervicornis]